MSRSMDFSAFLHVVRTPRCRGGQVGRCRRDRRVLGRLWRPDRICDRNGKGRGVEGFWLGFLLGIISWIIVALMSPSEELEANVSPLLQSQLKAQRLRRPRARTATAHGAQKRSRRLHAFVATADATRIHWSHGALRGPNSTMYEMSSLLPSTEHSRFSKVCRSHPSSPPRGYGSCASALTREAHPRQPPGRFPWTGRDQSRRSRYGCPG